MATNSRYDRSERAFRRFGDRVVRHRAWVITATLVLTALLAAALPQLTFSLDTEGYLRSGDQTLEVYDAFRARYGREDRILVGIEPREVFELETLERIRALHADLERSVPHLVEVMSPVGSPRRSS